MPSKHARHAHAEGFDPDLILRVIASLRRLSAATNEWQRSATDGGYTTNQALVLHRLVAHGDAAPSELADWMHVTRGSITPTIKRLEDLGLLSRHIDETDGRRQILAATPEAHDIAAEVQAEILDPIHETFATWTPKRLRRFCKDLDDVLASPLLGGTA